MKRNIIIASVLLVLAVAAYFFIFQNDDNEDPIPDVSHIKTPIKIDRFDQDFFAVDTNNLSVGLVNLEKKYPLMFRAYTEILNDRRYENPSSELILGGFLKSPYTRQLNDTVQIVYKDLGDVEKELSSAFQFFKYYFPKKNIPQVAAMVSEYSFGGMTYGDSLLVIGFDCYLGKNHSGYQAIGVPSYQSRSFDKTHLATRTMEVLIKNFSNIDESNAGKRLIDIMVDNGKKLYILDKIMPYTQDSVIFDYPKSSLDWCKKNEILTWSYILNEKLLFSERKMDWDKLVNPSPMGTVKMPTESPGRVGNWIGYNIVKAYMRKFPETTFEQLLAQKDAQKILDSSKYKPKRN
jgi:hypothetical protein